MEGEKKDMNSETKKANYIQANKRRYHTNIGLSLGVIIMVIFISNLIITNCLSEDRKPASKFTDSQSIEKYHQEQEHKLKSSKLKNDNKNYSEFASWIAKTPYFEIKKSHRIKQQINYIHGCLHNVDLWIQAKSEKMSSKEHLAQKYQDDINNGNYADEHERRIKEDYIAKNTSLSEQQLRTQLLNDLKNNIRNINNTNEKPSLAELQNCLNIADSTIRALYKYYAYKDEDTMKSDFTGLKKLADNYQLAKDLDFKVHILLSEEANKLKNGVVVHKEATLKNKRSRDMFAAHKPAQLQIMEATNQQFKDIDPDHPGFQSRAYKQRMTQYYYLDGFWNHATSSEG